MAAMVAVDLDLPLPEPFLVAMSPTPKNVGTIFFLDAFKRHERFAEKSPYASLQNRVSNHRAVTPVPR
ncbi:MAG TPA: hypothetical protein VEI03_23205 [Stellaceae bacterium]|nr:hypothetical protein [Stellaceae bacterium]